MNSLREADLTIGTAPERDAREGYYWTASEMDLGHALRVLIGQAGRGGDAFALQSVEIEFELAGEHQARAEEY